MYSTRETGKSGEQKYEYEINVSELENVGTLSARSYDRVYIYRNHLCSGKLRSFTDLFLHCEKYVK